MKKIITSTIALFYLNSIICQEIQWAGPDTVTCGEKGVVIGIPSDPCPSCCYKWEPTEGLSCTDCKNPKATPKHKTTYKIQVVRDGLMSVENDEVEVGLKFGEMQFNPKFLTQGTSELAFAFLSKKLPTDDIVWKIIGPDLGIQLEDVGDKARLTPGDKYGKIKIRAYKSDDTLCKVEEFIEENAGVKDVIAEDLDHPERKAKNGETLYVIGHGTGVKITAIPNDNQPLKNGLPKWVPDDNLTSQTPPDGNKEFITAEPLIQVDLFGGLSYPLSVLEAIGGNKVEYLAGSELDNYQPRTKVVFMGEKSLSLNILDNIKAALKLKENLLKGVNFDSIANTSPDYTQFCPLPNLVSINVKPSAETAINIKATTVEKFNDPNWGIKAEIEGGGAMEVTGKIYDPRFTRCFEVIFGGGIKSELYLGASFGLGLNFTLTKDPSLEKQLSASINAKQEFCLLGGASASAISGILNIEGEITLKACGALQEKFYAELSNPRVTGKFVLDPLTANIKFKVSDPFNFSNFFFPPINGDFKLIEGYESSEIVLFGL